MIRRIIPGLMLAGALAVTACERAPTAPGVDVESLVRSADPNLDLKPVSSTLPSLFRESIAKVEAEQGRVGVQALLSDWRSLQDELKDGATTTDRAAVQSKVDAIHSEELKVVLRALGQPVLTRVISELSLDLANAQAQISGGAVDDGGRADVLASQVRQKLAGARAALVLSQSAKALDLATQAATILSGLDYYLIEMQRIGGLETLYPQAVDKLKTQESGTGVGEALSAVERSNEAARDALRDGNRQDAQKLLEEARAQQISLVLKVLGPSTALRLINQLESRTNMLRDSLSALRVQGIDVTRHQRMLNEAVDLAKRARAAADRGDPAAALDLGSHAAGMLNALQHLTWK